MREREDQIRILTPCIPVYFGDDNDSRESRRQYRTWLETRTQGWLHHARASWRRWRVLDFTRCGEFRLVGEKELQKSLWERQNKSQQGENVRLPYVCFLAKSILGKMIFIKKISYVLLLFKSLLELFWSILQLYAHRHSQSASKYISSFIICNEWPRESGQLNIPHYGIFTIIN